MDAYGYGCVANENQTQIIWNDPKKMGKPVTKRSINNNTKLHHDSTVVKKKQQAKTTLNKLKEQIVLKRERKFST